jgi:hypothetical protein
VSPLVSVPTPNYVLLHDARYRPLWDAYLRLVRHQQLLDSAWRWQRRVWVETCLLAMLAAAQESGEAAGFRADIDVGSEHTAGRFISPASALPPLRFSPDSWIDVVVTFPKNMDPLP